MWEVFNVPRVWLWSVGCCGGELTLPQGEGAALMRAMGAEMAIWPGDSHVGGRVGVQTLQRAGWDGTELPPLPATGLGPGTGAGAAVPHQGSPDLTGKAP